MGRLIFLVLGIVCASCLDATQITVHITTGYSCGDTNTGILVGSMEAVAGTTFTATRDKCIDASTIGRIVVVPSQNVADEVYLRIVAGVDGTKPEQCVGSMPEMNAKCIEARRILRFVQHRSLDLPVRLDRSCINVKCADSRQTCIEGTCKNAVVNDPSCIADPSTCPDAGPPADSGVDAPPPKPIVTARMIAAGFDQACAVRASDDALVCWGKSMPAVVTLPVKLGAIKHLAIGGAHACASDGTQIACWGSDAKQQVGGAQPILLGMGVTVTQLVAGDTFTCALGSDTKTRCWGAVLDDPNRTNEKITYTVGTLLSYDPGFDMIAAGARHVCGATKPLGQNYTVYCWGDNAQKQCNAISASTSFAKPAAVFNYPTTLVAAGFDHSGSGGPVSDPNGNKTYAWGGGLTFGMMSVPNQLAFQDKAVCALEGSAVRCAPIGNNPTLQTLAFPTPTHIATGRNFVCARSSDGRVFCEGSLPAFPQSNVPYEIVLP